MTNDKAYSAIQEIIIDEDKDKNKYNLHLSTPKQIVLGKNTALDLDCMNQVVYENKKINSIKFKHEILDNIISVEKEFNMIKDVYNTAHEKK